MFSLIQFFAVLQTVAHQAPLSMGFSRQEYWNGLPFPPPGDFPDPGNKPTSPVSPAFTGRFFITEPPGKPQELLRRLVKTLVAGPHPQRFWLGRFLVRYDNLHWHHWCSGHELGQTPGGGEGQGSVACCNPWGCHNLATEQQPGLSWCRGWLMLLVRDHTLRTTVIEELTETSKLFRFLELLKAAQRGSQFQISIGWKWGIGPGGQGRGVRWLINSC